jgi:hypothetical protein
MSEGHLHHEAVTFSVVDAAVEMNLLLQDLDSRGLITRTMGVTLHRGIIIVLLTAAAMLPGRCHSAWPRQQILALTALHARCIWPAVMRS